MLRRCRNYRMLELRVVPDETKKRVIILLVDVDLKM